MVNQEMDKFFSLIALNLYTASDSLKNVARARFQPGVICGLSLVLVLALRQGFFSGFSGFFPSAKTNISNSNSTR